MHRKLTLLVIALTTMLLMSSPATAQYLWFDLSGLVEAEAGDAVTVDIYLHAQEDDILYGWGLNVGFDDAALDGLELQYVGYTYGPETLAAHGTDDAVGYLQGTSHYDGGSVIHAGRYDWSFLGDDLAADDDYLLLSIDFTFVGGLWGGEDVWIEWGYAYPNESWFDLDTCYGDDSNISVQIGPDYSAAVPVPAAVWLLGSGLLGLVGLRRRRSR